jgi:hypothetical protein
MPVPGDVSFVQCNAAICETYRRAGNSTSVRLRTSVREMTKKRHSLEMTSFLLIPNFPNRYLHIGTHWLFFFRFLSWVADSGYWKLFESYRETLREKADSEGKQDRKEWGAVWGEFHFANKPHCCYHIFLPPSPQGNYKTLSKLEIAINKQPNK